MPLAAELFPECKRVRNSPRKLMHLSDAGPEATEFTCKRCSFSDWYVDATREDQRRGIPCPNCDKQESR